MHDLLLALRRLVARPIFALTATSILALGIGATTAAFTLVSAVLLEPLPYPQPDRLVRIWKNDIERGFDGYPIVYPEYELWREASASFDGAALVWRTWPFLRTVTIEDEPRSVRVLPVSASFFEVLRLSPARGRLFETADEHVGEHPGEKGGAGGGEGVAAVLSDGFWRRVLGGDPEVIGRRLLIPGSTKSYRVIGVLAPGVDYPADVEIYVAGLAAFPGWREGYDFDGHVLARLRADASLEEARAELETIAARLAADDPDRFRELPLVIKPLLETIVGDVSRSLWLLFGAAGLVLAVAVANVASLFLVRGTERQREMAVRAALGAGRLQLLRMTMAEATILAGVGAVVGLLLGQIGLRSLLSLRPDVLPRQTVGLDWRVFAVALVALSVGALVAGGWPALRAARTEALAGLRASRQTLRHGRALATFVVVELVLSFVLLVGAGLLTKALVAQLEQERGFRSERLVAASLRIPSSKYRDDDLISLLDRIVERASALPGVTAVAPVSGPPASGASRIIGALRVEGQTEEEAQKNPWVNIEVAHEDYFSTLGLPILRGRGFEPRDRGNGNRVAIVSEAFAGHHWPGQPALGKRIGGGGRPLVEVIGVAANVRYHELGKPGLEVYFPLGQNAFSEEDTPGPLLFGGLLLSTRVPAEELAITLRRAVREIDPDLPLEGVAPVTTILGQELEPPRLRAVTLVLFAALALVLAAVGIYGVVATVVGARRGEIGVRLALGSTPAQAVSLVWRRGALLVVVGLLLGSAAAWGTTRLLVGLLHGIDPLDPSSFAAATVTLVVVGLAAAYLPARRAASVSPSTVLRQG